jgi:hypothetical protein
MSSKISKPMTARVSASRLPARRNASSKAVASKKTALKKAAPKKERRASVGVRTTRRLATPRRTLAHASSAFKAATYVWRRLHDGNIIAQASPLAGMGSWQVSAYRTTNDAESAYEPRAFSLLREAHHGADELVERHFAHTCRTGVCGRWLRWPDE